MNLTFSCEYTVTEESQDTINVPYTILLRDDNLLGTLKNERNIYRYFTFPGYGNPDETYIVLVVPPHYHGAFLRQQKKKKKIPISDTCFFILV